MKKLMAILTMSLVVVVNAETNTLEEVIHTVSNALQTLKTQVGNRELQLIEGELLCFEYGFNTDAHYKSFIPVITNNWQQIVTNINLISTNYIDRLLILGTGKQGDEELFLQYYETLARMKIDNEITTRDFNMFKASVREDLHTILMRRYNEPVVSNLIETLKIINPDTNYWNTVLSGEAYQMHLEMTLPKSEQ